VAQAADADDADARGGAGEPVAQRAVDGDAAAEQRADAFAFKGVGNGDGEAGVDADLVGIAAVAADAGGLGLGAEVLFAEAAPLADAAGVGLPADADALADLAVADGGADGGDLADDLMAGDEGVLAEAPVVVDEVDVGVADAAVGDLTSTSLGASSATVYLKLDNSAPAAWAARP
jgi:hypothetical protein